MDLAIIQKEVETLAPEEQDRLAAYLTVLRMKRSPAHAEELSRRLDDRNPDHWMTLDELKAKLSRNDDPP